MRARLLAVGMALVALAAGAAWLGYAAPADRPASTAPPGSCPPALAGLPPFWAAMRGETVGSYVLEEVSLCPTPPRHVRRLRDDVGWISSGGGVTVVVESGGPRDQVAFFDGRTTRPVPGVNRVGSVVTPAVSRTGDVAVAVYDARTTAESIYLIRRNGTGAQRLYTAPPGRGVISPSWNARGDLVAVERPDAGRTGSVNLVLLTLSQPTQPARLIPTDRPNATTVHWLDDHRVILGDYVAAPDSRPALFDVERRSTRLLPVGLIPVAVVPGRASLIALDPDRQLVLLTGRDLRDEITLGSAEGKFIGQGAFVTAAP